jgi:hypothetical protein
VTGLRVGPVLAHQAVYTLISASFLSGLKLVSGKSDGVMLFVQLAGQVVGDAVERSALVYQALRDHPRFAERRCRSG